MAGDDRVAVRSKSGDNKARIAMQLRNSQGRLSLHVDGIQLRPRLNLLADSCRTCVPQAAGFDSGYI